MARPSKQLQPLLHEVGQPQTQLVIANFLQDAQQRDLQMPARLCTYDSMARDDAVYAASSVTSLDVIKALTSGSAVGETTLGKEYAERINYNLHNLSYGSWYQACLDIDTADKYGFSLLNTPVELRPKYGWCLSKLSPRDQKTVWGWLWDENFTEVVGFVQTPNWKNLDRNSTYKEKESYVSYISNVEKDYTVLKRSQYLHFTCNSTSRNPQGDSPFYHAYTAWSEKKALEKLEIIGAGKDLGGLFSAYAPASFLQLAQDAANNPREAAAFKQMQENIAKLQDGRSSLLFLPGDRDQHGNRLYDVEIKGITGAGKQYNTSDIIEQKKKSLYNCWGAGHLLLGQSGVGSNALFNGADLTHSAFCQRLIDQKVDVINTQLIPRLLAINGIFPSWKDMPKFKPKDNVGLSWDEMGKFLQRTQSVQMLTPAIYKKMAEIADLPSDGIEELDYTQKGQSRSGEGFGTSGNGKPAQSNSSLNVENKSLHNFVVIEDSPTEVTVQDSITGDISFISKGIQ